MASSDKITHDQVAEEGIIRDHLGAEFEELINITLPAAQEAMRQTAKVIQMEFNNLKIPTNAAELDALNQILEKTRRVELLDLDIKKKKLDVDAKLSAARRREEADAAKKLKDDQKQQAETQKTIKANQKLNDVYEQAKVRLSELSKQLKTLEFAGQGSAVSTGILRKEFDTLKEKIDIAEHSVGQFQRQVGNYSLLDRYEVSLGKLSKGLKGFGGLGGMLSNALGVDPKVFDGIENAAKVLKELHHAEQLEGVVKEEQTTATQGHTAAVQEEIIVEKEASAISNVALGLWGLLAVAIAAGAYAVWNYISAKKSQKEIDEANIKTNEEVQVTQEKINKLLEDQTKLLIKLRVLKKQISKEDGDASLADIDRIDKRTESMKELHKQVVAELNTRKLDPSQLKNGYFPESEIRNRKVFSGELKEGATGTESFESLSKEEIAKRKSFNEAKRRLEEKHREELLAIDKTAALEVQVAVAEDLSKEKKVKREEVDIAFELMQDRIKLQIIETRSKKHALDLQLQYDINANNASNLEIYQKLEVEKQLRAKYLKDLENLEEDHAGKMIKIKELKGKMDDSGVAEHDKRIADRKKRLKEELELEIEFVESGLARKNQLEKEQIDANIDLHQREIIQQQELAAKGLNNHLAAVRAEAAADELARQKQAEKVKRQQEVLAFFKLFAAYAERGDPDGALGKALLQMGLAEAVTAGFYEGTRGENVAADLGAPKRKGKDGYDIRVDGDEKVFNPGDSALIPKGMSNNMVAKIARAYQMGYLPEYKNSADVSIVDNSAAIISMTKQFEELKEIVKNRRVGSLNVDASGTVTKSEFINGLERVSTKKRIALNYL